jgi:hypothetical protein
MKSSHVPLRGSAVAVAVAAMLNVTAPGAPKPPEAAPAAPEAAEKTSGANKSKTSSKAKPGRADGAGSSRKPPPAAAKSKSQQPEPVNAESAPPSATEPAPEKKGLFKRMFGRKEKPATPETVDEPKLAAVKPAKPAPVKVVKPAKSTAAARDGGTPAATRTPLADTAAEAEQQPEKKRGLFGFLRRAPAKSWAEETTSSAVPETAKLERPADWQDKHVVKEDHLALYQYGPAQANGPDARLGSGTVVSVKKLHRGWALVEVSGGNAGYLDAAALRPAEKHDFKDPVIPAFASVSKAEYWAPAAPPPDLPDQPGPSTADPALLLLPPLEPPSAKP